MKLGDTKPNVKELAFSCMEGLCEEKNTGPALVASMLYKKKGLPKSCSEPKHLVSFA
jgi:hypothetical protein